MKKQLFIFYFLAISFHLLSQNVYHVSTSGNDTLDGLTWGTSFATIQHAINESYNNTSTDFEVWVAEGTYYPTECLSDYYGLQTDDVYKSFVMYSGVNVYGGFEGNETTKEIDVAGGRQLASSNSWEFAHPTILDGSTYNSYHVVWFGSNGFIPFDYEINALLTITLQIPDHLSQNTILDGFSITGGSAIKDVKFENTDEAKRNYCHTVGGGVALVGNGEVYNCNVYNNIAKYSGAGVGMYDKTELYGSLIDSNICVGINFYSDGLFGLGAFDYWRVDGAGLSSMGSKDYQNIIDNCVVSNNLGSANDNYPDTASLLNNKYNNGGGVYIAYTTMRNTLVKENTITKNPYPYDDGAHASCGAGLYIYSNDSVISCEVSKNTFTNNEGQNGAGIFIADYSEEATDYSDIVLKDSYIHSNLAGGAVCVDAQYSTIENCIVANNTGSGIYGYANCKNSRTINTLIYNNSAAGWVNSGSADNDNNEIISSTIVNNGTGISLSNTNTYKIYNTVVWGNNSNPDVYDNADVQYSAFSFNAPVGTNNIEIDADNATGPVFILPTTTYGTDVADWENADWGIEPSSQLLDSGKYDLISPYSTTDLGGNARLDGDETDIGAFELVFLSNNMPQELNSIITIAPNPTNGIFSVFAENVENIKVYNNIGQLVMVSDNQEIDMSDYPNGLYFVKIMINNNIITKKLIKK